MDDRIIIAVIVCLAVSKSLRDGIAYELIKVYDYVSKRHLAKLPVDWKVEKALIFAATISFFLLKVKAFRKDSTASFDNKMFLTAMGLGVTLGFLIDIHDD